MLANLVRSIRCDSWGATIRRGTASGRHFVFQRMRPHEYNPPPFTPLGRLDLRRIAAVLHCALIFVLATGCSDVAGPDWFAPGTARQQRTRAMCSTLDPDPVHVPR